MEIVKQYFGTKGVRIPADLAEMLSEIVSNDRSLSIPEIIDPLIRKSVEREFANLPEAFQQRALARIEAASK